MPTIETAAMATMPTVNRELEFSRWAALVVLRPDNGSPHSWQKRAPGGPSAPQAVQLRCIAVPHSGQNLPREDSPHSGQVTALLLIGDRVVLRMVAQTGFDENLIEAFRFPLLALRL